MHVSPEDVQKAARLARIALAENRVGQLQMDLDRILTWVGELEKLDIEGVEPMSGPLSISAPERNDEVNEGGQAKEILANAPRCEDGFFVVPKTIG